MSQGAIGEPGSVPLPHGTEVESLVDRARGDDTVARGAIGRVVGLDGDEVDVNVVGVGVVRYRRDELSPRKAGQVRYARRRAAAWSALRPCVVLEAVVGSRAWGLADASSDVDRRGVFALPFPWTTGLVEPPGELSSADGSETYWEIGKMVRQALRADPNTLETLFVPGARALDPVGEMILAEREAFVSTEIYGSFGRYAMSQLDKLTQSLRLAEHRAAVLGWLRDEPALGLDALADRLADASGVAAPSEGDRRQRARGYVKQLYRSMYDQGLLPSRDLDALRAYAQTAEAAFTDPRALRPKNAYNLIRLLHTATVWLRTGRPELEVTGALREQLLAIKRGEVALDQVLAMATAMTPALDQARLDSPLPAAADVGRADALLQRARRAGPAPPRPRPRPVRA